MEARLREAEEHGEVLRYVGSYDAESGVCQVGAVLAAYIAFVVRLQGCLLGCVDAGRSFSQTHWF